MSKFNMQNVLIWIKPISKGGYKFRYRNNMDMADNYLRLQIENSLEMGWPKEDIVLITNFPFEYMGVKANEVSKVCSWSAFANKLVVVDEMIKRGIINDNIWLHDMDAYQLVPFCFPEECKDVGFTRHAPGREKPQGGSSFYRKEAYDIIGIISQMNQIFKIEKEESFFPVFYSKSVGEDSIKKWRKKVRGFINRIKNIKDNNGNIDRYKTKLKILKRCYLNAVKYFGKFEDRFSWLNWTYCLFRVAHFDRKYPFTDKPVKVAHFHVEVQGCLDCFYYGKNKHKAIIVTDKLEELFIKHKLIPIEKKR